MAQRAGVSFELERLDLEGDRLVVAGHWSGVRGLRFVRPALVSDDRRILATLEHKPWAPSLDRTWVAAFPWDRDDVDVDGLALAVGSQVTVSLGDAAVNAEPQPAPGRNGLEGGRREDPSRGPAARKREPEPRKRTPRDSETREPASRNRAPREPETREPEQLQTERRDRGRPEPEPREPEQLQTERRDRGRPELAPRERETEAAPAEIAPPSPRDDRLAALEDELYAMTRERDSTARERDRALAQLDEAVAAREAAVRTRTRMEVAHDEALRARERVEVALATAQAQRDEANAQRDEVLLAYRGLQRHVKAERVQEERARAGEPGAGADPDQPIGVRTMPAARTVMAELQRPTKPASRLPFSAFDLWVIRVLGTVAGACFILLLVSIMRVFI
ncbi:MAG: hypothetical protein ACLGI5_01435 [Thermoleophilia bacterium]